MLRGNENPKVFLRTGVVFRNIGDLEKSKRNLEQASALHTDSKSHFELAFTLQKMAMGHANPCTRGNVAPLEILVYARYSKDDPNAMQAIEHFKKSLTFSPRGNVMAPLRIVRLSQGLGENTDALEYIKEIIDKFPLESEVVKALQAAGFTYHEMNQGLWAQAFDDMENCAIVLAVAIKCQQIKTKKKLKRVTQPSWESFSALKEDVNNQIAGAPWGRRSIEEEQLMAMLKYMVNSTPILEDLLRATDDTESLRREAQRHLDLAGCERALLALNLLTLVQQHHEVSTDDFTKAYEFLSRKLLLQHAGEADSDSLGTVLNVSLARLVFLYALENRFTARSSQPRPQAPPGARQKVKVIPTSDGGNVTLHLLEEKARDWHVLLLHEPSAERDAQAVLTVLRDAFGWRVTRMGEDGRPDVTGREALAEMITVARVIVCLSSCEG